MLVSIKQLIEQSKQQVAVSVNATITTLYRQIGKHINEEILKDKRAEYGKQIVSTLSRQLTADYGRGWGDKQPALRSLRLRRLHEKPLER